MSTAPDNSARDVIVQAVLDRVAAYQETAPEGTLDTELRKAFAEAGLTETDDDITDLVAEIENGEWHPGS